MWCSGSSDYWCGMHRRVCVWACALLLLCAALAHAYPDKRAEMSPVPFVMGSRYGRSPARPLSPRNDRFFLGSRYGKRASMTSPQLGHAQLDCEYTGVFPLYRCVRAAPLSGPLAGPIAQTLAQHYDDSVEADRADRE